MNRRFFLSFLLLLVLALAAVAAWLADWMSLRPLPPSGGLYFPGKVVHDVPQFFQNDSRWGNDLLGPTQATLAEEGCAVASAAMVLASKGVDVDPGRLNRFVHEQGGYTDRGWLYWEAAAAFPPGQIEKAYEDKPSYFLIDTNLLRGNPVIVRLRYPNGITHFVVIVGKSGFDYLIRDPGQGGQRGVYPLKDFGSLIEALRFYRALSAAPSTVTTSP